MTLPLLLLALGSAAEPSPLEEATHHQVHGDAPPGAIAPGARVALELTTAAGEKVQIPDAKGRTVVLELIRSADW